MFVNIEWIYIKLGFFCIKAIQVFVYFRFWEELILTDKNAMHFIGKRRSHKYSHWFHSMAIQKGKSVCREASFASI